MAADPAVSDPVSRCLRALRLAVAGLPSLARRWREQPPFGLDEARLADQVSYRMEWADLMDRLAILHGEYARGAMSDRQVEEYCEVVELLRRHLAIVKRLQLEAPEAAVFEIPAPESGSRAPKPIL